MQVLQIDASARRSSLSRRLGATFVESLRQAHPTLSLTCRDLAAHPVPHITEAWTEICDNVMRHGLYDLDQLHEAVRTPAQRVAWNVLEPYLNEVLAADLIVVATPMYNFSVPSALKAWLDQITFPKMRLGHRRFVVLAVRGGTYQPGTPRAAVEHQVSYLSDFIQGHFALPEPEVVAIDLANARVDPGLADARHAHEESLRTASVRAIELGSRWDAAAAPR